jgi:EmrB/QacA subfamily drug resistance transporter
MTVLHTPPAQAPAIRATPCTAPCAPAAAPWVLAATILASSMVFIDGTLVNVALPALQRELVASLAGVQWVVEAYALFLAALLLVGGSAGDRFGRRRVFAAGVALFAAASIWCGLASAVRELIVARAVQGIGGALLVPGSLAIISASFDEGERGKAIGTWSAATAVTMALGPVLGGWMIDHWSWRAAFFINVPFAAIVFGLTMRYVPESRSARAGGRLDWPGALLVTLGLGAVVYALIEAPTAGWTAPRVALPTLLGALALAAFVVVEMRQSEPMIPQQLFQSRAFTGANLLTLLLYAALGGGLFFVPLNLIQIQHYSSTAAGAALLPLVVLVAAVSRWTGGFADRHGARGPLIAGPIVAACGFALFAVPGVGGSYWSTFFPGFVVLGLGLAISVAPLTTTVMSSVPAYAGAASGINNAASRVGGLLAVALFGIIMVPVFDRSLHEALDGAGIAPAVSQALDAQRSKLAAIELPAGVDAAGKAAAEDAIAQAFVAGFRWIMFVSAALALAGALSAWALIGDSRHQQGEAPR